MSEVVAPIEGLSAVSVPVRDIERSRKFYTGVLGLKEVGFQAERRRAVFAIPGTTAVLTMHEELDPAEQGRPAGTVSGIIFLHRDPAAAMEEIRRRGGTVANEVQKLPWGLVRGVFADPDGNEFVLASPA